MNPNREEIQTIAQKIRPAIERVAEVRGWTINENRDIADSIIEGLARNKILYGKRYCPCRIPTGNEDEDRKIICPCHDSTSDIVNNGHCHCYLFFQTKQESE